MAEIEIRGLRATSPLFDIATKLDKAEKQIVDCDLNAVNTLIEIKSSLDKYDNFKGMRRYDNLVSDYEIIKKDLITGCMLKRK